MLQVLWNIGAVGVWVKMMAGCMMGTVAPLVAGVEASAAWNIDCMMAADRSAVVDGIAAAGRVSPAGSSADVVAARVGMVAGNHMTKTIQDTVDKADYMPFIEDEQRILLKEQGRNEKQCRTKDRKLANGKSLTGLAPGYGAYEACPGCRHGQPGWLWAA